MMRETCKSQLSNHPAPAAPASWFTRVKSSRWKLRFTGSSSDPDLTV